MSLIQVVSLATLAAMFVIAIWRKVNIGLVALPAAYVFSRVAGIPTGKFMGMFPVKLVMLIIGVTILFMHAERSGVLRRLVDFTIRHGGRKTWVMVATCFSLPAALTAAGAFGPASAAVILPIAKQISRRMDLNYLSLGMATILGSIGGSFSPLSPSGALAHSLAAKAGRQYSSGALLALTLIACAFLAGISIIATLIRERAAKRATLGMGNHKHARTPASLGTRTHGGNAGESLSLPRAERERATEQPADESFPSCPITAYEVACLFGIFGMLVAVFGFGLDVGFVSLIVSLVLLLAFRPPEQELIGAVPWSVIILLSGLLMYIGVLESIRTLDAFSSLLSGIGSPFLALLSLTYLCAVMSNVESSAILVVGLVVPVAFGIAGNSPVTLVAFLAAIAVSTAAPVLNPVHIGGALILSNSPEGTQQRMFRTLFAHALTATVLVPGIATLIVGAVVL